ncbi:hypothetical protein J1N35_037107, partial [Gossypium stocksii]
MDQVAKAFNDSMDMMQGVLNTVVDEVTEKNDVLEDIVLALEEQVKKLKGELNIYKVALGNEMLVATPMPK